MKNILFILILIFSNCLFSQLDYKSFVGEKSKISFNKEYTYTNIYDYKVNAKQEDSVLTRASSINIPEGILTDKYSSELLANETDSIVFEVILYSRLLVDINSNRNGLIKYSTRKGNEESEMRIISLINKNNEWKENTTTNKEIELLKDVFLLTDVDMLFEFFNSTNNPDFEEINKLKPLVKNPDGALNIRKLAKVLEKNRAVLSQYLKN